MKNNAVSVILGYRVIRLIVSDMNCVNRVGWGCGFRRKRRVSKANPARPSEQPNEANVFVQQIQSEMEGCELPIIQDSHPTDIKTFAFAMGFRQSNSISAWAGMPTLPNLMPLPQPTT